jgi:thioredoxin reductase/predicted O-methyltransferase YrrM
MSTHDHHPAHEPWHDLPDGFADKLDFESKLNTPVRDAVLDQAALALGAPPRQIVDFGSGTGADAVALAERFPTARVHALDVSTELLDRVASAAAEAGIADRIERHLVDLNTDWTSTVPRDVDLAWASLSLHHLSDLTATLRRMLRSLKPGGVFVLTELTGEDRLAPDWSTLLAEAGFASVERHDDENLTDADLSAIPGRAVWVAVRPESQAFEGFEADVAVLGGGFAGLAAAIALARSRRSVVVIDAGKPRNAPAAGAHNVLGHEGISPLELLDRGRAEAEAYGVRIISGQVTGVTGQIDDFTVQVGGESHRIHARRIILATGLVDDLPRIPGVEEGWGSTVLHCPFCHGWEVRDQRIGVLTRDELAMHQVMLFSQLSDQVTVFLNDAPEPSAEQWEQLGALKVSVVRPKIERLLMDGTQVRAVEVEGGDSFEIDAVAVVPKFNARTELYESLGGAAEETPFGVQIPADPRGLTEVPGVWAAGNASQPMAMVTGSAASGLSTGAAVHGDLSLADLNEAVRVRTAVK